MEKDLTTLLAERDVLKHKAELEKLREENLRLMQQVSDKIDNAKASITESAITKTMEVLDKTRLWLQWGSALFAAFIAVAGLIGYNSLSKELTAYYTDTVRHWLRFDDNNTGGRKALDDLRTSALLDSLTLKYERDKTRSGIASVSLNPAEKLRLMSLILDPATEDDQYMDALRLVIKSRSPFGWSIEDETGKKIAAILGNNDFSNNKRAYVLSAMRRDRSLFPWSLSILNDTSGRNNEGILMDAFRNVSVFDQERARRFAEENMNRFHSDIFRIELAEYLINIGADGSNIDELIESLKKQQKNDSLGSDYRSLIFARVERGFAAKGDEIPVTAQFISEQVNRGMSLGLSSFTGEKPSYRLLMDNFSSALLAPEQLMGNTELIDAIVKAQPLTLPRLLKLSHFFQTRERGLWITTLMMKPAVDTELIFDNAQRVNGSKVLDYIWLRVEQRAGEPVLIASWRGKSGEVHEAALYDVNNGEKSEYHIDFNSDQLRSYTWSRDFNNLDSF